jgi:hypothetical protein
MKKLNLYILALLLTFGAVGRASASIYVSMDLPAPGTLPFTYASAYINTGEAQSINFDFLALQYSAPYRFASPEIVYANYLANQYADVYRNAAVSVEYTDYLANQ